jgi:hypothetical protein
MAVNLAGEAASKSRRIAQGAAALLAASILVLALRSEPAEAFGPDVSTFTLANGMEVVVIPDHRAPVATHMVWYRVGAADEGPGKSGIAHFLEHLMFKGTHKIAPGEFSKSRRPPRRPGQCLHLARLHRLFPEGRQGPAGPGDGAGGRPDDQSGPHR